ncbi:hypothetical protein [Pseudooceanicola aestuarii]|uniref:hypothetical protein n=1 Tax=Pseudooceanicola aestuarii TaxID=2697319 RepID=UPI0013D0FBEE|nr:hypothetical protein [Pseudooceanicola aestuarii]
MQIGISHQRGPTDPGRGPVRVGWFLNKTEAPVIYDPPRRVNSRDARRDHAKSAARCPAVLNLETRYFEVPCPYDLNLGFARDAAGKPMLRNLSGGQSSVRGSKLGQKIHVVREAEWRYPDRPTIQMGLPYVFIADEPVYLSQLDAYMHYSRTPRPGTIFGGRYPIDLWPRPLMWAFEWHDIDTPLVIRRGEPLFYCQFEADGPDRAVQLVEAEKTPELETYLDHISGAVNYVSQTFSLFDAAARVRPDKLLKVREK